MSSLLKQMASVIVLVLLPPFSLQMEEPEPRYARIRDAAAYAKTSPSTVRSWVRLGHLRAWREGPRLLLVDLNDVDRLRRLIPTTKAPRS